MSKNLSISIRVHISLEKIADLLYTAGDGSNYWAEINTEFVYKILHGKTIYIKDKEDKKRELGYGLDLKKIKRGLTIMAKKYPTHFTNFINENLAYDEITGDVFLQCCLFGEIKYSY